MRFRSLSLFLGCLLFATRFVFAIDVKLPVKEHQLDNGLKILTVERHSVPVVSFALYYRVGSIDDPAGKKGMAHYCEHMMFKSTKNLEGESFSKLVGAVGGGHSNANTSMDRTCYHATIPPDRLELIIRLEAERMANLQPSREEAATELEVVKEELRQGYIDDPMGKFRQAFFADVFHVHPYGILTIGLIDDLNTITYDDLLSFYHTYYAPSNAVAIIVGDFETDEVIDLMERFFGTIPPGKRNPQIYPVEPEQTKENRIVLELPVQHSNYFAAFKAPNATHPDAVALELLTIALSRGGSSPLGLLSQGENPVAMYAGAYFRGSLEPYPLMISGAPLPGIAPEELEKRIDAELTTIATNGLTEEQFEKARAQLLAADVFEMQSSLGVATSLGEAEVVGSWRNVVDRADRLAELTREDVRRVAASYLRFDRRTAGILKPQSQTTSVPDDSNGAATGDSQ